MFREQPGVERDHDVALPANARRLAAHDPGPRCGKLLRRDRRPLQRRGGRGSRMCRIDPGLRRVAVASTVTITPTSETHAARLHRNTLKRARYGCDSPARRRIDYPPVLTAGSESVHRLRGIY